MIDEQGFNFDKFMDDTILKEKIKEKRDISQDEITPLRKYVNSRRENPYQLMKIGVKNER